MGAGGSGNVDIVLLVGLVLTHCCSVLAILHRKGNLQSVSLFTVGISPHPSSDNQQGSYVEDEPRRNYRVEDFFWSGSGDGSGDDHPDATWTTTTIFMTTTILTTVYHTPVFLSSATSCSSLDCMYITPTPSMKEVEPTSSVTPTWPDLPDQRYWLRTILKANSSAMNLSAAIFEQRLARIYKTAFHRQQERHLGLDKQNGKTLKRERRETVSVKVHQVSAGGSGGSALELIYTVRVAGKAVDAAVAAQDMNLVGDNEVTTQLGFPVLTKAEPFLKPVVVPPTSNQRDIWLIVGASISTILLVLLLLLFFLFNFSKKKSRSSERSVIVHRETKSSGKDNMGFQEDLPTGSKSPKKDAVDGSDSDKEIVKPLVDKPSQPAESPAHELPRARPRHKLSSPNSYLSMPSVKAFPRGAPIPGPLENVLEPENPPLARHSSASQDPGVVGPLVWDLHCHRLSQKENDEIAEAEPSVGKMRRRFHELLDDAFSLFGSRSGTPEEDEGTPTHNIYGRAKSAVIMPVDPLTIEKKPRPKTSDGRPATAGLSSAPRGAWDGTPRSTPPAPRAPPRPLSAGPFHKPNLEPAWILSDSMLKPTDPAVPLIAAIKKELDKFPSNLPGAYRM